MQLGLIVLVIVVLYFLSSVKILRQYEKGVIFRLGKLLAEPKGPGVILVFWPIDQRWSMPTGRLSAWRTIFMPPLSWLRPL
jgi:regulator of protease activity HflC (stomatin/prohibitin superfamily)